MLIILSIICFAITFFILRNLYKKDWRTEEYIKVKVKLWQWMLAFFICCLPVANLIALVIILGGWITNIMEGNNDIYIKSKCIDKIINFLNKEL